MHYKVKLLTTRTLDGMPSYLTGELPRLALSLATIFRFAEKHNEDMDYCKVFYNVMIRDTSAKHDLFDAIAYQAVQSLSDLDPLGLVALVRACALAGWEQNAPLFDSVATELCLRDLSSLKHRDFSNLLWAYTSSDQINRVFFSRIADEIVNRQLAPSFSPRSLAKVVNALANAKVRHPRLYVEAADEVVSKGLASFDLHGLASLSSTLALAKVPNKQLFEDIAAAAILEMEFDVKDAAALLRSFATMGLVTSDTTTAMFESLAVKLATFIDGITITQSFTDLLDQCNTKCLSNIAWSFCVANIDSPMLFNSKFCKILHLQVDWMDNSQLCQLYMWILWQKEELSSGIELSDAFVRRCHDEFVSSKANVSVYHKNVMSALRSAGFVPSEKILTRNGFLLDACVEVDGKTVSIRVDGKHHFVSQELLTGKAMLRRRLIENEGIHLISIPHWEWEQLGNDQPKQEEFLRNEMSWL